MAAPPVAPGMIRLAVVGDIHGYWDPRSQHHFDGYDAVIVLGDLPGRGTPFSIVARAMGQIRPPTLLTPGNHDPARALATFPGTIAAYSLHRIGPITLVAGRPHSAGGPRLRAPLPRWSIATLEQSAARLCALVEEAPTSDLVFISHNGPSGLGPRADDPWGCDFGPHGDWGDPDLRAAIDHAARSGKRVRAVCAGHMHLRLRDGRQRRDTVRCGNTLYLNAAQVPRIERDRHHHVVLTLQGGRATARTRWIESR